MKKNKKIALDFEIDKLTNSIQNTVTGDSFLTEVSRLTKNDLKQVTKKNGWAFNWKSTAWAGRCPASLAQNLMAARLSSRSVKSAQPYRLLLVLQFQFRLNLHCPPL